MHVLAIDQGTSATKAMVVDPDGAVVGAASAPVHPRALADGGVEQDPEELWHSVLDAGRQAVARAGVRPDALGLANQGRRCSCGIAPADAPSTALSWQDRRAIRVCARLAAHADALRTLTGPRSTRTSPPRRCAGCGSTVPPAASAPPPTPGSSTA